MLAGGADAIVNGRFGAGGEIAALTSGDDLLVAFSGNGSVRLGRNRAARTMPFVTGGYSFLKFFDGSDHAFNVGAGVDVRRAIRLELRDIVRRQTFSTSHYWTVRLGMTFR